MKRGHPRRMNPGRTEFTRTPSGAKPRALFLVQVRAAPVAEVQAGEAPKPPVMSANEEMLTADPWGLVSSAPAQVGPGHRIGA